MRYVAGLALLLIVAAGLSDAEPSKRRRERRREPRCFALRVVEADSGRSRGRSFSASEVGDLRFELWVHESASSEPIELKLFNPRGKLYQRLALRSADAPGRRALRARVAKRFHLQTLAARFPVTGTHVTAYALFGEWRAEAFVGDAENPCSRPLEFVLEP